MDPEMRMSRPVEDASNVLPSTFFNGTEWIDFHMPRFFCDFQQYWVYMNLHKKKLVGFLGQGMNLTAQRGCSMSCIFADVYLRFCRGQAKQAC